MPAERPFAVDLDELVRVVGEMTACQARLHDVAEALTRQVRVLHGSWAGEAAAAHEVAQRVWDAGFGEMRDALATMRAAADAAHHHYAGAAATNVEMWGRLR